MTDRLIFNIPRGKPLPSDRDVKIFVLRTYGVSYDQIAKQVDVGKARCRRIVKDMMSDGYRLDVPKSKVVH